MVVNTQVQIEQNYSILIETAKTGGYRATALGLPNCRAKGTTRDMALQNIRQLLTDRLSHSEIVTLKIDTMPSENPWINFAGMFKDDPHFAEMLDDIQAYRQEIDQEVLE
jgi:predicted RNase H-like HicB family nuclease